MQVRYKNRHDDTRSTNKFNVVGLSEVDMGDDSAYIKDLDVFIPGIGWKDMKQAFADRDIIVNNHNTHFDVPLNDICRSRGYND